MKIVINAFRRFFLILLPFVAMFCLSMGSLFAQEDEGQDSEVPTDREFMTIEEKENYFY